MDVSNSQIVLKEVGNSTSSGSARALVGTSLSADSRSFSDYLGGAGQVSEAKQQAGENIAVLTGEDYQSIESDEGALEEYESSALDRAIERHKERRQWQQETMESGMASREEFREQEESFQVQGFADQKTPEEIAVALEEANIPATQSNIAKVSMAMDMAEVTQDLSQGAKVYMLQNELTPTIENLYQGQYQSGATAVSTAADEQVWQQLVPQVAEMLSSAGMDVGEDTMTQAEWLFANDLPVTPENLDNLQRLDEIGQTMTPDKVLDRIVTAMETGAAPEQASLDDTQIVIARNILQDFAAVTDEDIQESVEVSQNGDITLALLKEVSAKRELPDEEKEPDVRSVERTEAGQTSAGNVSGEFMARRQLEEIRLKMTLQSVVRMQEKGIDVEVTPLQNLVEELRDQEASYYKEISAGFEPDESQMDLLEETLAKTGDIMRAPAQILASGVRQQDLLTLNVLHRTAVSTTVQMQQYQKDYEAVGTQVRADLGDSIQKAFQNIPDILSDLSLEATEANQRAVRILGYNNMEITAQNITEVKEMDARVNSIINHMKPTVVMELIHRGDNPLEVPLEELDKKLVQIEEEKGVSSEEKYSRYLWKLEQDGSIAPQERDGYIGVYRLLNQIDQSDGAVVGTVLETGREMTLGNLLTALRTRKAQGMDTKVDDSFGGLVGVSSDSKNITTQIESGFGGDFRDRQSGGQAQDSSGKDGSSQDTSYYDGLVKDSINEITPARLQEISQGELQEVLQYSLEGFKEQLQQASGDDRVEQQLYAQLAEQLRQTMEQSEEAVRFLGQMELPDTVENIQAVEMILEEGVDIYREMSGRSKKADSQGQKQWEELMQQLSDFPEDEETISSEYEKAGQKMQEMLKQSYESPEMTYDDLQDLKRLAQGIALQRQLVQRHSYDVPVETGDTVTSVNVTLIQGEDDSGRVQIFLPSSPDTQAEEGHGKISVEFRVSGEEVKGLVLCEDRKTYDRLLGQESSLTDQMETDGYTVKALSYGMEQTSRLDMGEKISQKRVPTPRLYHLAKITLNHLVNAINDTDSDA
jgi:hypothetical protein